MDIHKGDCLYQNPLTTAGDVKSFVCEGDATITFSDKGMQLSSGSDNADAPAGHGNFVLWCPQHFPDNIAVSWDFTPKTNIGLAMIWVAAQGRNSESIFSSELTKRSGGYPEYHSGDINALHASYFRRNPQVTHFRTCNLRKSHGFHLVCQSGDPLPDVQYVTQPYRIEIIKNNAHVIFSINDLILYHWVDDGGEYGAVLTGGHIGFRQMNGLVAEYANLSVDQCRLETC